MYRNSQIPMLYYALPVKSHIDSLGPAPSLAPTGMAIFSHFLWMVGINKWKEKEQKMTIEYFLNFDCFILYFSFFLFNGHLIGPSELGHYIKKSYFLLNKSFIIIKSSISNRSEVVNHTTSFLSWYKYRSSIAQY